MNLYKILMRHYSQKDCKQGVVTFVAADSAEDIFNWIDSNLEYGCWTDKNDEDGPIDIYDEDCNVIGAESFKEKMIRVGGEYFDEDYEPSDLYYGATTYGWELVKSDVPASEVEFLAEINILKELEK